MDEDDSQGMFFFTVEMEQQAMQEAEQILHEYSRKQWEEMLNDTEFVTEYNELLDRR